MSRIDLDSGGELVFERGSSSKQPEGKHYEQDRPGFQEGKNTLPKHVPPDQSAVEIDAQNRQDRLCGFGSRGRPHGMIVA